MLSVTKGAGPVCLVKFSSYVALRGTSCLQEVRDHLVAELDGYCAYCERRLAAGPKLPRSLSIEHIRPQKRFPTLQVSWTNLIGTCTYQETCNHHKEENYDESFLSPVDDVPPDFLELLPTTGEVQPKPGLCGNCRPRAECTLRLLNLNHASLVGARRKACRGATGAAEGGIPPTEYLNLIAGAEDFVPMMRSAFEPAGPLGGACPGCGAGP